MQNILNTHCSENLPQIHTKFNIPSLTVFSSCDIQTNIFTNTLSIAAIPCDAAGNELPTGTAPSIAESRSSDDWSPFRSSTEFKLAELLFKKTEMSAGNVDELMELWSSYSSEPSGDNSDAPFYDHKDLQRTIDSITIGDVPWESFEVKYDGNVPETGHIPSWMTKEHHVYYRNPLEVVRNLISNENFKDGFDYTPFREFQGDNRRWTDVMSGNWAWKQAVSFPILCICNTAHIILSGFNRC